MRRHDKKIHIARVNRLFEQRNLNEFAKCLHQAWEYKKKFGDNITNTTFNNLYDFARSNGAIGGKLLGAGGGGFFLFKTKLVWVPVV